MRTCVVAADHPGVRAGLRSLLELHQACTIVGEAATSHEALALTTRLQPDVLLVDLAQPAAERLHLIRRVRAEVPTHRRGGPDAVGRRGADGSAGAGWGVDRGAQAGSRCRVNRSDSAGGRASLAMPACRIGRPRRPPVRGRGVGGTSPARPEDPTSHVGLSAARSTGRERSRRAAHVVPAVPAVGFGGGGCPPAVRCDTAGTRP